MGRKDPGSGKELGEFSLIREFFAPLVDPTGGYSLEDDAGIIQPGEDEQLVLTTDGLVAGVHFLPDDPPDLIARKLLRVNLSDLAAMGAEPRTYLLFAAFNETRDRAFVQAFARGLEVDQKEFGVTLLGGDTVATPGPDTFSITAVGTVPTGSARLRSGAQAGDELWVSGTIGDAVLGLKVLKGEADALGEAFKSFAADRYRLPRPRTDLGLGLNLHVAAMIDISDGLAADLGHVCDTSRTGADVDVSRVPLSDAVRAALDLGLLTLEEILTGGDDYELLFTAAPHSAEHILSSKWVRKTPVTRIGTITADRRVRFRGPGGTEMDLGTGGYRHF